MHFKDTRGPLVCSASAEKILMTGHQTVLDAYKSIEFNDVALVRGELNIADALT